MKPNLIVFIAIILFVITCKKDDEYWGTAKATKNGKEWEAKPAGLFAPAFPDGYIGIIVDALDYDGYRIESLSFSKVPLKVGVYALGRAVYPHEYAYVGTSSNNYIDGDIGGDSYELDTTALDNYFEVVSFKSKKKEIELRFTATYVIVKRSFAMTPDTLKFTDGYIKTRVQN